jgi:hypothetical protein
MLLRLVNDGGAAGWDIWQALVIGRPENLKKVDRDGKNYTMKCL